jgi:hypothetical protein
MLEWSSIKESMWRFWEDRGRSLVPMLVGLIIILLVCVWLAILTVISSHLMSGLPLSNWLLGYADGIVSLFVG